MTSINVAEIMINKVIEPIRLLFHGGTNYKWFDKTGLSQGFNRSGLEVLWDIAEGVQGNLPDEHTGDYWRFL